MAIFSLSFLFGILFSHFPLKTPSGVTGETQDNLFTHLFQLSHYIMIKIFNSYNYIINISYRFNI